MPELAPMRTWLLVSNSKMRASMTKKMLYLAPAAMLP